MARSVNVTEGFLHDSEILHHQNQQPEACFLHHSHKVPHAIPAPSSHARAVVDERLLIT